MALYSWYTKVPNKQEKAETTQNQTMWPIATAAKQTVFFEKSIKDTEKPVKKILKPNIIG